ncbi:thiosulfate sulfurtransferase GlpE [Paraneptunicella aestuarii]|uniref:thiosulfate sulfurtransferase GlpE n=1 Tax=Paraneptunicella aestuarii TaxID=2831148 RepID=UPI001E3FC79C|nr:thiosulfate sulfurtransferase GlpE [Paraneptunicella aestuarii]UAA38861.1 thiosulfate sulfurtransferase GlpE [Paraneptunicella aestuarii]
MVASFKHISVEDTRKCIDDGKTAIVDIRDPASYTQGKIGNATRLDNASIPVFLANTPKDTPVIVYCYRGVGSQQVAQFLCDQGFEDVSSMDGGYEAWNLAS